MHYTLQCNRQSNTEKKTMILISRQYRREPLKIKTLALLRDALKALTPSCICLKKMVKLSYFECHNYQINPARAFKEKINQPHYPHR